MARLGRVCVDIREHREVRMEGFEILISQAISQAIEIQQLLHRCSTYSRHGMLQLSVVLLQCDGDLLQRDTREIRLLFAEGYLIVHLTPQHRQRLVAQVGQGGGDGAQCRVHFTAQMGGEERQTGVPEVDTHLLQQEAIANAVQVAG